MELLNIFYHITGFIWSEVFIDLFPFIMGIWQRFTFILPVVIVACTLQILIPGVKRKAKILSYEMWVDVIYAFQSTILYLTAFGAVVTFSSIWLTSKTPVLFPGISELPFFVRVLIGLWLFDFAVYWRHRFFHEWPFLWPIHVVHHSSRQVDVLTTARLHFLEVMAGGIINRWIGARFGVDADALNMGFMIYLYYNYFIHSNIKVRFPGFLKYILVSPFMHRWHHAIERQAVNKNYSVVFAWNDWLFGSAIHPDREPEAYGVKYPKGEEVTESYIAHQLYPFKVFFHRLKNYFLFKKEPESVN